MSSGGYPDDMRTIWWWLRAWLNGETDGEAHGEARGEARDDVRSEDIAQPGPSYPPPHPWELPEPQISYSFMSSSPFAKAWYKARELGEHDRAAALHILYTQRPWPGGAFPDPRGVSAFSNRAVIGAAAKRLGVRIWPAPPDASDHSGVRASRPPHQRASSQHEVWLISHQPERGESYGHEVATIAVRTQDDERVTIWYLALMLGLIAREPERVGDPHTPKGVTTLPGDAVTTVLLHRYAKALLNVQFDCSETCGCDCAEVEQRLNYPPADHEQPTMIIHTSDVRLRPIDPEATLDPSKTLRLPKDIRNRQTPPLPDEEPSKG